MPRPRPTSIYHFTHLDNLESIVAFGLRADSLVARGDELATEIGNRSIKTSRRDAHVAIAPGGVVADYVPFYFAPRSPMMNAIHHGRVPEYTGSIYDLVYLSTTIEALAGDHSVMLSDRNACLSVTRFSSDVDEWDDLVDWPLMRERYWNYVPEYPDRRERRMAECLVHQSVPWSRIKGVAVYDLPRQQTVQRLFTRVGVPLSVVVSPQWYF